MCSAGYKANLDVFGVFFTKILQVDILSKTADGLDWVVGRLVGWSVTLPVRPNALIVEP